jgi:hypothetical protein
MLLRVAEENNVTIEVHSNSLETPIEYYGLGDGSEDPKEVIRIFKSEDEEMEETVYQPIVKKDGSKRNLDRVEPLRRENRFNVKVHTNPDIKVLWNLTSDLDLSKDICSCIVDCEVVDMWPQRFEELKAFIDENERRPAGCSKNQEEKQLGNWLGNQLGNYKRKTQGMKITERYELWTQFLEEYKEYFMSKDEQFDNMLLCVKTFMNDNKRRPFEKTGSDEEKKLGRWLTRQIMHYKNKTEAMTDTNRYDEFTKFILEYKQYITVDRDDEWYEILNDVINYIKINKTKPPRNITIGAWINTQHNRFKIKQIVEDYPDRYLKWNQFLKEYKQYFISFDEKWFQHLDKTKEFIDTNKRRPLDKAKDLYEKQLAVWVTTQFLNLKKNGVISKDENKCNLWIQFLEEYNEYIATNDEIWLQNFEKLKIFINLNKKKPSDKSKNNNEKQLGRWIACQISNYKYKKNGMKNEERYNLWTQFLEECKEYFASSKEEIWLQTFEELKTFISINKKKPSDSSKNQEEKQLGQWLYHQKKTYKTKTEGMKDELRYNLWTQFLEEYKEYFNPKEEDLNEEEFEITVKPKQKKTSKLPKLIPKPKVETKEDIKIKTKPLITQFHNKFCKMRSDNLAHHFQQTPSDFAEYHRVRDECFQTFEPEDIPCNRIIAELNKIKKGGKHIVDMGCGTANIAEHFKDDSRFQFTNYDHVAINDTVQVCDISHMPIEDNSVDICIMSLALWGSNCEEYVKEALRVLDENGILYIIDSTKRWSEEGMQDAGKLKLLLEANGFQIKEKDTRIDKWCYFKCMK